MIPSSRPSSLLNPRCYLKLISPLTHSESTTSKSMIVPMSTSTSGQSALTPTHWRRLSVETQSDSPTLALPALISARAAAKEETSAHSPTEYLNAGEPVCPLFSHLSQKTDCISLPSPSTGCTLIAIAPSCARTPWPATVPCASLPTLLLSSAPLPLV